VQFFRRQLAEQPSEVVTKALYHEQQALPSPSTEQIINPRAPPAQGFACTRLAHTSECLGKASHPVSPPLTYNGNGDQHIAILGCVSLTNLHTKQCAWQRVLAHKEQTHTRRQHTIVWVCGVGAGVEHGQADAAAAVH
jgi:hypothetical protein